MPKYQVTGHYCTAKTNTAHGPMIMSFHRGAILPADVAEDTIKHLLSVNLITEVPDDALPGVDAAGIAITNQPSPEAPGPASEERGGGPAEDDDKSADDKKNAGDIEARREAARAKLPADGSAPHANAGQQVWVEHAVRKGYDRTEMEAADRADIIGLFK